MTCRACNRDGHNLRGCVTEAAARHFDLSGLPGTAARIRRQVAALAKSREVRRDEIRERANNAYLLITGRDLDAELMAEEQQKVPLGQLMHAMGLKMLSLYFYL